MKAQAIYVLSLATFYFYGAQSATFTFKNYCPFTVWPGILTGSGPELSSTGFELPSLTSSTINIPSPWSGRFWGRTECTNENGDFHCATGDCPSGQLSCNGVGGIPPVSLAEFTLAANNGQDFFDISLVDGFNLPLSIAPQLGGSGGCTTVSCTADMNAVCPQELQVIGSFGSVIACNSACLAFNLPQFCCTGAFSTPQTCPPTNYSNIFKSQCPQANSYAYDKSALASCTGGTNYVITFCP